eukprot:gb/GEZN01004591.1/.p1 GENE.gb/GEZN01004591.1/~~gb/GEZN01004591.1/.p1  ORF type:complete len:556 (-),score=41.92 gb/GEZN01004591.1/:186-1853(-)
MLGKLFLILGAAAVTTGETSWGGYPQSDKRQCQSKETGKWTVHGSWSSSPSSFCYCDDGVWTQCTLTQSEFEPCVFHESDILLEWHTIMMNANAADYAYLKHQVVGPLLTARAFAMTSCAMYDSFNSVTPIGDKCKYVSVNTRAKDADRDVAIAVAAHDVLCHLFSLQTALFDQHLQDTLSRYRSQRGDVRLGIDVGREIASYMIEIMRQDQSDKIQDPPYQPTYRPGFHVEDPDARGQGFYAPNGAGMSPFAVSEGMLPLVDDKTLNPAILNPASRDTFMQSKLYTDDYEEVLNTGSDGISYPTRRTEEQTFIAVFWAYDGRPFLGTPLRLYNQILREVMCQQNNTAEERVRLLALVNLAMHDAAISAWRTKYQSAFWRPKVGIRNGGKDSNSATVEVKNWTPLGIVASNPASPKDVNGINPNFPSFTSGHSEFGAALFTMMKLFYGKDDIKFTFLSDELNGKTTDSKGRVRPRKPRVFSSFSEAAKENAKSRVYLGVHWNFDADEGVARGSMVAEMVYAHTLRPLPQYYKQLGSEPTFSLYEPPQDILPFYLT